MKFKAGDKVKVVKALEYDARFRNRSGVVQCYTTDEWWVDKGTPLEVVFDNGPEPVDWDKNFLPFMKVWPRYSTYYFSDDEIELID